MMKCYENRQKDFLHRFQIEYRWEQGRGYFTIWCHDYPPDPHNRGTAHHHLYPSGQLCQREGYESRMLEHAEAFAFWWMKRWSTYVHTGAFPMTPETIDVPD